MNTSVCDCIFFRILSSYSSSIIIAVGKIVSKGRTRRPLTPLKCMQKISQKNIYKRKSKIKVNTETTSFSVWIFSKNMALLARRSWPASCSKRYAAFAYSLPYWRRREISKMVENGRNSNFQGLVTLTLTLDPAIRHTVVHHSTTSTYIPNFIQTFSRYMP